MASLLRQIAGTSRPKNSIFNKTFENFEKKIEF